YNRVSFLTNQGTRSWIRAQAPGWREHLPPQQPRHLPDRHGAEPGQRLENPRLSPSWYLQHVIIRDLQSSKSYFFLVNDWLSVESEENDGMVEKEVYAASETDLRGFSRIFIGELQRGFFEKHVWLSMWDRPPRSRFTRVQRATCCCVLVFLFLCANVVWYGVVGDVNWGPSTGGRVAVSNLIPVTIDTVAVGLVSSVVVYPLYLVLLFLFRMTRSKVRGGGTGVHWGTVPCYWGTPLPSLLCKVNGVPQ
uniref:Polycystin 1, transient receptor potential channel interacting n=1 Tax=Sphenodon punctatus TaxID=8508 RepID=A0A8D0H4J4_SPHPU